MKKLAFISILLVVNVIFGATQLEEDLPSRRSNMMTLDTLSKISVPPHCGTTSFSDHFTIYDLVPSSAGQPWIMGLYDVAEASTDPHYHKIKTQTYVILEGETTLHIGPRQYALKAGQVVTIPPHLSHILKQDSSIRFLVVDLPNLPYPQDHYEKIEEASNEGPLFISPPSMTQSVVNENRSVPLADAPFTDLPLSAYQKRLDLPTHTVYEICQDSHHTWSVAIIDIKDVAPHSHKEGVEHFIVLSGILKIDLEGTQHILMPGQSVHIPPSHVHHLSSATEQAVRVLCVNFPAFTPTDFYLEEPGK